MYGVPSEIYHRWNKELRARHLRCGVETYVPYYSPERLRALHEGVARKPTRCWFG